MQSFSSEGNFYRAMKAFDINYEHCEELQADFKVTTSTTGYVTYFKEI